MFTSGISAVLERYITTSFNSYSKVFLIRRSLGAGPTKGTIYTRSAMKPVFLTGTVVHGFGRGSRDLGCPTANLDKESIDRHLSKDFTYGIYYGWAKFVSGQPSTEDAGQLFKMVASVGLCPFFKNELLSVEVHLIHQFPDDFYGATLKVAFLGRLRGEKNFSSVDELIKAIRKDVDDAKAALDTPESLAIKNDPFFA